MDQLQTLFTSPTSLRTSQGPLRGLEMPEGLLQDIHHIGYALVQTDGKTAQNSFSGARNLQSRSTRSENL